MTDTSERLSKIELPNGFDGPLYCVRQEDSGDVWWEVQNERGDVIDGCDWMQNEKLAKAIASIPAMGEEIGRLRNLVECKDCMEYAHQVCATVNEENDRLRSLNAEMREALDVTTDLLEPYDDDPIIAKNIEENRAILTKTEAAP